jgi:hypothetical protein
VCVFGVVEHPDVDATPPVKRITHIIASRRC